MTDSEPVVDLRGRLIDTRDGFRKVLIEPGWLPEWPGRNLDTWSDRIETDGFSQMIDSHDILTVRVGRQRVFDGNRQKAEILASISDGGRKRLVVHAPV